VSARVQVGHEADGRLVARKVARDSGESARLAAEAAVLTAVRHPGVVELVELREADHGQLELVTGWVGSRSLADALPLSAEALAAVMVALCETVADLHELGFVHHAIDASHVLLDQRGRPVLCGFGRATTVTDEHLPSTDVAALGQLLVDAVGPIDGVILPERRWLRPRRQRQAHRDLLTLADHARADDPTCRPTARALARNIAALVPTATLPAATEHAAPAPGSTSAVDDHVHTFPLHDAHPRTDPDLDPFEQQLERLRASASVPTPTRARPPWFVGSAVLAVASLALGWFLLRGTAPADGAAPVGPAPEHTERPAAADRAAAGTAASTPPTAPTTSSTTAPSAAAQVPEIEHDGARYRVGEAGDEALVGDWRCDGQPTVALLRPGTGAVFVFDGWAHPGVDTVALSLDVPPGVTHLESSPDSCPTLTAVLADGRTVPVPLPRRNP
jgi:hypothetical protein